MDFEKNLVKNCW